MVQETFLRLWTKAGRFDGRAARLTTWLHRVAHNLCIDRRRREARLSPLEDDWQPVADDGPWFVTLRV